MVTSKGGISLTLTCVFPIRTCNNQAFIGQKKLNGACNAPVFELDSPV